MLIGNAQRYAVSTPSSLAVRPSTPPTSSTRPVATLPAQEPAASLPEKPARTERPLPGPGGARPQDEVQGETRQTLAELASRDREVRSQERARAAAAGRYAGAVTYSYTRGPDGKSYVSAGEVSIDLSPVPNDPEATIRKMEIVQRAALSSGEPSSQDIRVAAQAQMLAAQARAELAQAQREAAASEAEQRRQAAAEDSKEEESAAPRQGLPPAPSLELYLRLSRPQAPESLVNLLA